MNESDISTLDSEVAAGLKTSTPVARSAGGGGDHAALALPMIVTGSLALALAVSGYAPVGAVVPVLLVAGLGEVPAARAALRARCAPLAGFYACVGGLWLTYTLLVVGLEHSWFGIQPQDTSPALVLFLGSWLAASLLVTVTTLALPLAYTATLIVLDAALAFQLVGVILGTPSLFTAAAGLFFALTGLAAYLCLAVTAPITIRRYLPLGPVPVPEPAPRPGIVFTTGGTDRPPECR